eukprot:6679972-Ditylum_brightwellii.AAC.1
MGLNNFSTWGLITHEQYESLQPLYGNDLPSMPLATLKCDEKEMPKHAKYNKIPYWRSGINRL